MKARNLFAMMLGAIAGMNFRGMEKSSGVRGYFQPSLPRRASRGSADKHAARAAGIPKAFRQYAKRYGGLDADGIIALHRQAKRAQA